MLVSRRPRILAAVAALTTATCTLSGAPQAAGLSLTAAGNDAFICYAKIKRRDGHVVLAKPMFEFIRAGESKYFALGPLPAGEGDSSPDFGALTLRCLVHGTFAHPVAAGGEAMYSIVLDREAPLWLTFDELLNAASLELPRDDAVLNLTLARTDNLLHAIRITEASLNRLGSAPLFYDVGTAPYLFTRN